MKRTLLLFVMLVLLCASMLIPAQAAGCGNISMSSASGNRGDTVNLNVNLNSNPGLVTMTIKVKYDTSVLQLTNVSNPGLLVGAQLNTNYGSPYTISWVDGAATTNNTKTGTIATFTFKILDNAKIGDSTVTLEFVDSYDTNYNENSFSVTSGKVTVNCWHIYGGWRDVDDSTHKRICTICSDEATANHNWNGGVVTKQPNCKETGTKIYTCADCYTTRTETVAKTTSHTYGKWTKVNDTTHKRTCSVCSKEETASHSWNSGAVTKQPTCKENGTKTYTCTACNATKTEAVAKTTSHTYGKWSKVNDSIHKRTCSVCSKEETASHSWNSGVVTKQPTCKETGIKTFTCTACSATKTDSIAKTTTHTYGKWTKVNDTTHKRTCTVCSKEETASHTWNSGAVTKQPTCKETGTKTYTCTVCNAVKTETVAKLTTHTYDHACDDACNMCGTTRTISHSYKTSWNTDRTNHWHECSVCKAKKDVAAHTPGAEATEATAQTCTTCGYVIKAALGHTHDYAAQWTVDETGHWYACSGCEEKDSYTEHTFENLCDVDCAVCGYTREVTHKFASQWEADEISHWYECSGCGLKDSEAAHEPGAEATATEAQLCTICGYVIAPALGEPIAPAEPADPVEPTVEPTEPATEPEEGSEGAVTVPTEETVSMTTPEPSEQTSKQNKPQMTIFPVIGVAALLGGTALIIIKKRTA